MNQAQEFIKDKVKNWKEKRFGSGGELIVHYDEVEKWLEEYAEQKVKNLAQPDVSGQLPPMFIRWCISKKIEVYSGDAIGITSMDEGGMFPVVSAERLFEIFMEETGGNFR